jgi:singapore isolate B (sub-type 7) whole genome shotgun sequence assembly, scaffold_11
LAKTDRVPSLIERHAGKLLQPPFSEESYLVTGGLIHQSDFELKRVLSQRSEINNTLTPSSPSSLKYTAFLDVSVGGFGWICLFSQGGDNTNKKVKQLESGTLQMFAVKGFHVALERECSCRWIRVHPS